MEQDLPNISPACASCGTAMTGKYCQNCGEKKLQPNHDFSILHFLEETFESFTHLDSRILRSFGLLFAKPGFLTAEFLAGRRVRYLKPIPLFLIAGVIFYLFFGKATAFFSNPDDMNLGYQTWNPMTNAFHLDTESLFSNKASTHGGAEEYQSEMFQEASHLSKTWLFLIVPAWGLLLWPFFGRRFRWLVPHLVYALHGLTFFILADTIALLFLTKIMGTRSAGDTYIFFLACVFAAYNIMAVRRVYQLGRLRSILAGLLAMVLFFAVLVIYRQSITIWTLMH